MKILSPEFLPSPGLVAEWTLATLYVFVTAVIWTLRFRSGAWQAIRVLRESDG